MHKKVIFPLTSLVESGMAFSTTLHNEMRHRVTSKTDYDSQKRFQWTALHHDIYQRVRFCFAYRSCARKSSKILTNQQSDSETIWTNFAKSLQQRRKRVTHFLILVAQPTRWMIVKVTALQNAVFAMFFFYSKELGFWELLYSVVWSGTSVFVMRKKQSKMLHRHISEGNGRLLSKIQSLRQKVLKK